MFESLRVNRAARLVADLEAVIRGRVVAGCDVDCAHGLLVHYRVGDDGGGRRAIGQPDFQLVARQHFRHRRGKMFTAKALVVPDHDPLSLPALLQKIVRKSLRATAHVIEGIFLGDHAAPAVCPECDFERHDNLQ